MATAPRAPSAASPRSAALLLGLALAAPACKGKEGGALARAESNDGAFANVPVPPADGPKLYAVRGTTPIYERPSASAKKLGELGAGSIVARSQEPYSKKDCEGGWYVVRPRGFACAGAGATVDVAASRGMPAAPDLARPLPYRYGRARSENVPVYGRIPTAAEQFASEPDLKKLLARGEDRDPLGAAANDVPLDARGVPTGPAVLLPGGDGIDGGKRTAASYFGFASEAMAPSGLAADGPKVGALRKGSGVAIAGAREVEGETGLRRFGMTADGRVVPTDRLKPALGTTWHGIDLEKIGLPVAFVHKHGVHPFSLNKGKATKRDDEIERRAATPLTGKFRTVEGVRFEETREGEWLRAQDLVVIVKRHKFPDFAKGSQKWIDVSVANQTLTAYEGTKPIYATLVSTGRDQLKDPATSASTARGTFKIKSKYVTRSVDPREVQGGFDPNDVPWVMELESGGALMGMYWGDGLGEAQTFHNVALSPVDAHRLFGWAEPQIPEGWLGVEGGDDGTIVHVRP